MSCLPDAEEWSPQTQWLLIHDHLEALSDHLQQIQSLLAEGPQHAESARPQVKEISQRAIEMDDLLASLQQHDPQTLVNLETP